MKNTNCKNLCARTVYKWQIACLMQLPTRFSSFARISICHEWIKREKVTFLKQTDTKTPTTPKSSNSEQLPRPISSITLVSILSYIAIHLEHFFILHSRLNNTNTPFKRLPMSYINTLRSYYRISISFSNPQPDTYTRTPLPTKPTLLLGHSLHICVHMVKRTNIFLNNSVE